jgi:serine/threonine protein kinase
MSPEQVMSQNLDGRSDLYSLGIILYELCTGSKPFVGDNLSAILHAITQDEAPDIRQLNPAIPKDLSEIIMKCLSKKPDDRFDSGTALAQALKDCSREEETLALRTPFGLKSQRTLIISITSAIIIFLTGTLLYYYLTNTSSPKSSLIVDSIPAGAQVYVNGEFSGETPVTMELVVGKHEVRLTALHYYEWEAQVQLEDPP